MKVVADAVRGNTHLQTVVLERNDDVTDASMGALKSGLVESGVVSVDLEGTGVSKGEKRAVYSCARNSSC